MIIILTENYSKIINASEASTNNIFTDSSPNTNTDKPNFRLNMHITDSPCKQVHTHTHTERERERETHTHTHTLTHTHTQRERHTHTHTHTHRERDTHTHTHTHTQRERDTHTHTHTHTPEPGGDLAASPNDRRLRTAHNTYLPNP